jgi:hypothetical protein
MRFRCMLATAAGSLALLVAHLPAQAQHGLQWGSPRPTSEFDGRFGPWSLQWRLDAGAGTQRSLSLLGDHYLAGPGTGSALDPTLEAVQGGLRLSGGLSVTPRHDATPWGPQGELMVLPYLGLGYTRLAVQEGWGFTADIGLGGTRPGPAVHFGLGGRGGDAVDRLLDELRLAPVVQLGVSYAF